jgi:hypothetical protein
MYENKTKLVEHLYNTFKNLKVEDDGKEVHIDRLLTPPQKYSLIMQIINDLPKSDFESIIELNTLFNFPIEETHIISNFKYDQFQFDAILTQVLLLGKAFNYSNTDLYNKITSIFSNVEGVKIPKTLESVLEHLNKIIIATYTTINISNLTEAQHEAMQEICKSTKSVLIPYSEDDVEIITKSVKELNIQGIEPFTTDLKNGYSVIKDRETQSILQPISYIKPNLSPIINKHLKTK